MCWSLCHCLFSGAPLWHESRGHRRTLCCWSVPRLPESCCGSFRTRAGCWSACISAWLGQSLSPPVKLVIFSFQGCLWNLFVPGIGKICLQTLLLLFKYANHKNKRSFVSTANEALVNDINDNGDVNNIFPIVSRKLAKLAPTLKIFSPRHAPVSAQLMNRIYLGLGLALHGACIFRTLVLAIWRFFSRSLKSDNTSYLSMTCQQCRMFVLNSSCNTHEAYFFNRPFSSIKCLKRPVGPFFFITLIVT